VSEYQYCACYAKNFERLKKRDVVVHTYNPSYWEAEIERIVIEGQSRQKVCKTPSQPKTRYGGVSLSYRTNEGG
jgi:hypothetical protein